VTAPHGEPLAGDDATSRSLGDLVSQLSQDLSRLMRQEVELAKTELKEEATKAGKGAGMLGGAGVAGWMTALFLSLTVIWALDHAMDLAWAALIVTAVWGIAAAALFVVGRNTLRAVNPRPQHTVATLKEDVQWVRQQKS
jgi:uncharacterized membrane protein YqjE